VATYPKNVWIGEPPTEPCPDHDCADDDPCGEVDPIPTPCTCGFFTALDKASIVDYADGMFEACAECVDQSGPAWDGTLWLSFGVTTYHCTVSCGWTTDPNWGSETIDGKMMTTAKIYICATGGMYFEVYCMGIIDGVEVELPIWIGIGECFEGSPDVVFVEERWAGCSPGPGAITVHFEESPWLP
jgi:hypothetical protein